MKHLAEVVAESPVFAVHCNLLSVVVWINSLAVGLR